MLPPIKIYTTPGDLKYALFDQSDVISDAIRNNGVWNSACLDLCDKVLTKNPGGGRVIDIGAGFGSFSIPLAAKYGNQFIFSAFEPLPIINSQLNTNVFLNMLSNVRVFNIALSDGPDLQELPTLDYERSGNHGSFSLDMKTNVMRNIPNSGENDVFEFRTLDSYRFANVRLIKVSAPGMEYKVLHGAAETLMNSGFPPVLFEAWSVDWFKEEKAKLIDFFASRGYEHYVMLGEHIMAFKTQAQYESLFVETPSVELASFTVVEQSHDATSVLQNQAALR